MGSKESCRSLGILLVIIKLFEKFLNKNVTCLWINFFQIFNVHFGYIAQHCLLTKRKKWKQAVGTLLTDLDSLPHEILVAELNAHGFRLKAFKLTNNYLSQTNQRTKINESSSSWEEIINGVLQDLLFCSIFFTAIFFFLISTDIDIASDADYINLYKACDNVDATEKTLRM